MKAKNYLCIVALAGATLMPAAKAFAQFSGGGSGTAQSPYIIKTDADLNTVRSFIGSANSDKHFRLGNDVDLTAYIATIGSAGWNPIGNESIPFTGYFHGGGHKVTGLSINRTTIDYVGLFGYISGSVDSLGVEGQSIAGGSYTGGLAGYSNGTVSNCYATGDVTATLSSSSTSSYAGGLTGYNNGTVSSCYATGNVTATTSPSSSSYAGGLIGYNNSSTTVSSCYATGNVTISSSTTSTSYACHSGGLIGNNNGTVSSCYATGNVTASSYYSYNSNYFPSSGGLIGYDGNGMVSCCYATGNVTANSTYRYYSYAGGLIGRSSYSAVSSCYATGNATATAAYSTSASYSGGLIGYFDGTTGKTVSDCYSIGLPTAGNKGASMGYCNSASYLSRIYYNTDVTDALPGIGNISSTANVVGSTTTGMKYKTAYSGWDFDKVWDILEGSTYPFLQSIGTIVGDKAACVNAVTTYEVDEGYQDYEWIVANGEILLGQGAKLITVQWGSAGEGRVSVSYGATQATQKVNVAAPPTNPTISGSMMPTAGSAVTYTTAAGMASYTWTVSDGGSITSGAGTREVKVKWGCTAGEQHITVSHANEFGCASQTTDSMVTVVENPAPAIRSSKRPSAGSTVTYRTDTGMTSYVWSVSGGSIKTGQNDSVVTVQWQCTSGAGQIGVSYTNPNSCVGAASADSAVAVQEQAGPVIVGNMSPPTGATLTYVTDPGMSSYAWTVNGGAIMSGQNAYSVSVRWNSVSAPTAGRIGVTYTNTNGCPAIEPTDSAVTIRTLSTDATLKSLTVSGGYALTPAFHPDTLAYAVSVPNSVTSVTLTPVANQSGARITGSTEAQALNVGANTFSLGVIAEDKVTSHTYTVKVTRAASSNAQLSSLTVSGYALTPAFHADTTSYTVSVANSVSSITISAAAAHAKASVNGTGAKSLSVGLNAISVAVTAEDNATVKTYTVTVTRAANSNALLRSLAVSVGEQAQTLSPSFSANTTSYTASVAYSVDSVTLSAAADYTEAIVSGTGKKPLNVGANTFYVVVTAEDGVTEKIYTVVVTRIVPSSNASLSSLAVSAGTLTPTFNTNTIDYKVSVAYSVDSITLTATATHAGAIVSGTGKKPLSVGANNFYVVATAEDGATDKIYTVVVTRAAASSNATLSNLTVSAGTLTPVFRSDSTSYAVSVASSVSSITLTATRAHTGASVSGAGAKNLSEGANPFNIVVTAEDGATTKTYSVTVTRAEDQATTTILSETFETGADGWTIANGSQTNKWYCGAATVYAGSKSMYVSNNSGTSNAYTITSASIVHFYRDVYFTPATESYQLNFRWKGAGESGYDYLTVYLVETSVTPTAGSNLSATALGTYNGYSTWRQASITFSPASYSGTTKRLVFSWRNNSSGGTQPPAAIDNIAINSEVVNPENDASLSSLKIDGETVPSFHINTTSYTVNVPYSVSSITLAATARRAGASVSGAGEKALNAGANTFSVVGTAADGVSTKTYTVTVVRNSAPSISGSMKPPAGSTATYTTAEGMSSYTWTVTGGSIIEEEGRYLTVRWGCTPGAGQVGVSYTNANSYTVSTTSDVEVQQGLIITGNMNPATGSTATYSTTSGMSSYAWTVHNGAIQSGQGTNTVSVKWNNVLVAMEGHITVSYTNGCPAPTPTDSTVIIRELSPDATLKSLTASGGYALTPAFNAYTTDYAVSVPNSVSSIRLTASANQAGASVSGAGTSQTLSVGVNTLRVTVTAENGATKTYTVAVTRAASSDARLSNLTVSPGTLTPAFNADTLSYRVSVANSVSSITLTAIAAHAAARAIGTGAKTLSEGANVFRIVGTAEDGISTRTYTVTVTRTESLPVSAILSETFETNAGEWTIVNGAQTNKWYCGAAAAAAGSKSMYISNNSGTSNAYTITSASVVHFYRDVYFPPATGGYQLTFLWKGVGETNDHLIVYLAETSATPAAGSILSTPALGAYTQHSTWQQASITLSAASYSGTTKRLVFSWRNDGSGGAQPPAAVDSIAIAAVGVSPQNDASLSSLTVSGATLTPSFHANTTSYTATVPYNAGSIMLEAAVKHLGASVSGTGIKSLSVGVSTFSVVATAPDGVSTKTYTVTVTRTEPILLETFETGASGWTIANGSQTNKWYRGAATAAAGSSNSMYISNNSGASNAYTTNSASIVHFYRDVYFPPSEGGYRLNFEWKGMGENGIERPSDYLSVYLVETSVTPSASLGLSGTLLGEYTGSSEWQQASITLRAATYSGTTKRLAFSWRNDDSEGEQRPAAVDNIMVVEAEVVPPQSDATLNNLTVTSSSTPLTLTPTFYPDIASYAVSVANSVSSVTLAATATQAGASVNGAGAKTLEVGVNSFDITVTAADGVASKTYTVRVIRAAITYTVTFSTGEGSTVNPQTVEQGSAARRPTDPTRAGYAFAGWYNGNDEWDFKSLVTANLTLTALWTTATYAVSFDLNGGSGDIAPQNLIYDAKVTKPANPSRAGYAFIGWWRGDEEYNFSAPVTRSFSLTAQWEPAIYTVTFNANGGSVSSASKLVVYNAVVGTLPVPTRSRYSFTGWNTAQNGNGTLYTSTTAYTTASNITLYAQWTAATAVAKTQSAAPLKIYPNPTTGAVTVESDGAEVQLYTLSGVRLMQTRARRIDLSGYPAGVYLLRAGGKIAKVVLISGQ
jgi:uncharacterized repeat protein (TIGR02543 family)